MPQRARVLNAQEFGLKLAWMDCWQKPLHLSTPTLVNKLACPWDCILSCSTCSDGVWQWLNWKETLSITDFCLIWKNLRLNRSGNFFPSYCGNSFRKRVPRTLKEGIFPLGCGDHECGILLICWLAPPSSGLYKNTSFHKTLALGNKTSKAKPPVFIDVDPYLPKPINHSNWNRAHLWKAWMLNGKGKDAGTASHWVKGAGGCETELAWRVCRRSLHTSWPPKTSLQLFQS